MSVSPRRFLAGLLLGGGIGVAALASTGCTPGVILGLRPSVGGPVHLTLAVPRAAFQLLPGQAPLERIRVTLVKDAHVLSREQPLEPVAGPGEAQFGFTFEQVYEGRWSVAGELVDAEGDVVYAGSASLHVVRDQTTTARLVLLARPSLLRIQVDLTDYARQAHVTAAGVNLKGNTSTTLRSTRPAGLLVWSFDRERASGTYDVQVVIYQQDGAVEFSSDWRLGVTLLPGKMTQVSWRPGAGAVVIVGEVDLVPSPPSSVSCQARPALREVEVAWTPPDEADLAAHRVYVRAPDSALRLAAEVPAQAGQALLPDAEAPWETGGTLYVGVTAVDLAGQESLHAAAECLIPPPED